MMTNLILGVVYGVIIAGMIIGLVNVVEIRDWFLNKKRPD